MIVLNPFLDSLCNFCFKNIDLPPGVNFEWFPGPHDAVPTNALEEKEKKLVEVPSLRKLSVMKLSELVDHEDKIM